MMPSCVAFTNNECLIGDAAKNQVARSSTNSIFGTLLHTFYFFFFFFLFLVEIEVTYMCMN